MGFPRAFFGCPAFLARGGPLRAEGDGLSLGRAARILSDLSVQAMSKGSIMTNQQQVRSAHESKHVPLPLPNGAYMLMLRYTGMFFHH